MLKIIPTSSEKEILKIPALIEQNPENLTAHMIQWIGNQYKASIYAKRNFLLDREEKIIKELQDFSTQKNKRHPEKNEMQYETSHRGWLLFIKIYRALPIHEHALKPYLIRLFSAAYSSHIGYLFFTEIPQRQAIHVHASYPGVPSSVDIEEILESHVKKYYLRNDGHPDDVMMMRTFKMFFRKAETPKAFFENSASSKKSTSSVSCSSSPARLPVIHEEPDDMPQLDMRLT